MQSLRRFAPCAALSVTAWSASAEKARPPRVGLVGTGWALRVQRPRFREAGLEVTALYSRDPERAARLAEAHGIAGAYDDVRSLAAAADVDLVSVVGPAHLRGAHVAAALAVGKDVLCEKPVALDAAGAAATLAAAEASGVRHFVDFELRCVPALRELRRRLPEIGAVRHVDVRCFGNFGFLDPAKPLSHWNDAASGGGVLSAVGTHYLDVCRWLFGDEVTSVSATMETAPGRGTSDALCVATLRLARGTFPVSLVVGGRTPGRPAENRLLVVGESGTLEFDFTTSTCAHFSEGAATVTASDGGDAWGDVGTRFLADRLVAGDVGDLATLADGLRVQEATDAIRASAARGGAWVDVGADAAGDVTLREIRERQRAFARERDWDQFHTPRNVLLALAGEVGELAECFQWKGEVDRGLHDFNEKERVHVGEELSDVLVYTIRLADVCGLSLEDSVRRKMAQNAKKYPADKARGRADKYTAYAEDRAAWDAKETGEGAP